MVTSCVLKRLNWRPKLSLGCLSFSRFPKLIFSLHKGDSSHACEAIATRRMNSKDQTQIREVLRDTIKLLCKNGLKYNTEFTVEGLLGITIDSNDIILVNINEAFSREGSQNGIREEPAMSDYSNASPKSNVACAPYNRNSFGRRTMGSSYSGLKKIRHRTNHSNRYRSSKVWVTDVSNFANTTTQSGSDYATAATGQNSIASNNSEITSGGPGGESQNQGEEALQRLADYVGRITSNSLSQGSSSNKETLMASDIAGDKTTMKFDEVNKRSSTIKEEFLSDSEIETCTEAEIDESQTINDSISSNLNDSNSSDQNNICIKTYEQKSKHVSGKGTEDTTGSVVSWFTPSEGRAVFPMFSAQLQGQATVTGGPLMSPLGLISAQMSAYSANFKDSVKSPRSSRFVDLDARDPNKEAECEYAAVRSPGCIVIPRILCRAKGFKVGNVMNAMKSMTRHRDDPSYIGEYKQISGNMKTFYKCPPELIKDEALAKYDLNREVYRSLYYQNPRPKLGGPVNWANYVEILMRHMPLGPEYYPAESMGLNDSELADLQLKQSNCSTLANSDYFNCVGEQNDGD